MAQRIERRDRTKGLRGRRSTGPGRLVYAQTVMQRHDGELNPVGDAQLLKQIGQVVLDGPLRDRTLVCDLLVRVAGNEQGHDIQLAFREAKAFPASRCTGHP